MNWKGFFQDFIISLAIAIFIMYGVFPNLYGVPYWVNPMGFWLFFMISGAILWLIGQKKIGTVLILTGVLMFTLIILAIGTIGG